MDEREKIVKAADEVEAHQLRKESEEPAAEAEDKAEEDAPDVEAHRLQKT